MVFAVGASSLLHALEKLLATHRNQLVDVAILAIPGLITRLTPVNIVIWNIVISREHRDLARSHNSLS